MPIPHWKCDRMNPQYTFDKNYVVEIPRGSCRNNEGGSSLRGEVIIWLFA